MNIQTSKVPLWISNYIYTRRCLSNFTIKLNLYNQIIEWSTSQISKTYLSIYSKKINFFFINFKNYNTYWNVIKEFGFKTIAFVVIPQRPQKAVWLTGLGSSLHWFSKSNNEWTFASVLKIDTGHLIPKNWSIAAEIFFYWFLS